MFRSLKKAVIKRAMNAEMSGHLGYAPGEDYVWRIGASFCAVSAQVPSNTATSA
jgi:hypothetical protein